MVITNVVTSGVDGVWLTAQTSSNGVPVLYQPVDLAILTDCAVTFFTKTAQQLQRLNAV
ncbi:hypothetical protein [Mycobacterium uberis]|uniref:hypothetical protein n=1 Tax=Mycobacterium uberis TaxID=2162698 RepID=UPI0014033775|nr:hypothetical protein [Mycobacterium uberis]